MQKLQKKSGLFVDLLVTQNRSTMINLLEKSFGRVRLSLHEMFLDAPEELIFAIADYIKGNRRVAQSKVLIRKFIQEHYDLYVFRQKRKLPPLRVVGKVHDLSSLYAQVNDRYFGSSLSVPITWARVLRSLTNCRVLFGKYEHDPALVKIYDRLDQEEVPPFFIRFVIYHELLHHLIPTYIDAKGREVAHGHDFKNFEKKFDEYVLAKQWEKKNINLFLKG